MVHTGHGLDAPHIPDLGTELKALFLAGFTDLQESPVPTPQQVKRAPGLEVMKKQNPANNGAPVLYTQLYSESPERGHKKGPTNNLKNTIFKKR